MRLSPFTLPVTRVDGQLPYYWAQLTGRAALVLGSEAHGLAAGWSNRHGILLMTRFVSRRGR